MPVTLPLEVYEIFEKEFGKEAAKMVIKSFEQVIETQTEDKWYRTKNELKEELLKEVATKADLGLLQMVQEKNKAELLGIMGKDKAELLGKMENDKAEILGIMGKDKAELLGIMEKYRSELLGKADKDKAELLGKIDRINITLKFLIVLNIIALTLMNPVMAEILKNLLKL